VALASFGLVGLAMAQNKPAAPAAAVAASASPSASSLITPREVPSAQSEQRFQEVLRAHSGGLTSDAVARRAELTSPEVVAKQRAVEGAAAKVDQAFVNFAPKLSFTARYTRLSPVSYPVMGYIAGGMTDGPIYVTCPPSTAGQPTTCAANNAQLAAFTFSSPPVDMYALQGSIAIPLSDYILRISQNYAAATHSRTAAEIQEKAARLKVQKDARVTFYNWARARSSFIVSEQGLSTAQAHLKDVDSAVKVGSASKADYMRVESQVAATELLVERTKNLVALVEEQLRVMMHDSADSSYELGEDLTIVPTTNAPANFNDLVAEALDRRLEVRALDETVYSLRKSQQVVQAGYLPRVDAFGDVQHQNPNTRYFPQTSDWHTTWDLGVQLSWTVNDSFTTSGQNAELAAKTAEIEAQKNMLRDGIRMEVMQDLNAVREADVALSTTARQLAAAEESYRVRRELFRAGRATSAELTDAETDLMKSRLDALNARMDARIAKVTLEHALGRDSVSGSAASR
jgi:outer membrane protein TolC